MKSLRHGQHNDNIFQTNFDQNGLLELSALRWAKKKCILTSTIKEVEIIEILSFEIYPLFEFVQLFIILPKDIICKFKALEVLLCQNKPLTCHKTSISTSMEQWISFLIKGTYKWSWNLGI